MAEPVAGQAVLPVQHRWLVTIGVMGAMVMQILDTTIANVALPKMTTSLGATNDTITWVLTSYII
ncbi:MAG: EmrB/QacA family drug resistance transporter, partial [Sphingomonas bacterium]|nr:EmrB/QacA family drug resistance transporter [Sphingomonas bacterium]